MTTNRPTPTGSLRQQPLPIHQEHQGTGQVRNPRLSQLLREFPFYSQEIADFERLSKWARFVKLTQEEYIRLAALTALVTDLAVSTA